MSSKALRAGRPVGKLLLAQMVPKPLSALSQYLPDEWTSMLRGSSDLKWVSLQMGRTIHRGLKPGPEALMGRCRQTWIVLGNSSRPPSVSRNQRRCFHSVCFGHCLWGLIEKEMHQSAYSSRATAGHQGILKCLTPGTDQQVIKQVSGT